MNIICSDVEGVWIPEVWVNVALKTGIEELRLTTRDISDYDVLMRGRLEILKKHNLKISDIQQVIATLEPLPSALEALEKIRNATQIVMVSDTFTEFAKPLMKSLGWPVLFCNYLEIDSQGYVVNYHLRQPDQKRQVARALKGLHYNVTALGDSYNDIPMLQEADRGILFHPPAKVREEYPGFEIAENHEELLSALGGIIG
ncbi:MAG: bifunctional phosphoserine phosphatase/homoserine phosphotransferase ThrH [Bacteroidales bacterium]|nr:bifunctional phosphoserine phosphatase/homoserine phosphotransferase ThrH [Bacteroidales bacterium]